MEPATLDRDHTGPDGVFGQAGHDEIQRWNLAQDWVISEHAVHEALVNE
jgi:hypothetical protein